MKEQRLQTLTIIISVIVAVSICSCKKSWLDKKPNTNLSVASTLSDFQAMIDNILDMNGQMLELGEVASDDHYVTDANWARLTSINGRNAFTWSQEQPYKNLQSWQSVYRRVENANIILNGIAKIKPASEAEQNKWNYIYGQALFHRALAFYWLSQLYAQPYHKSTAATDAGIPLRLDYDVNIRSVRASVKDTYDRMIEDAKAAADLLPGEKPYGNRSSKTAAFALLARIYIAMDDYVNCLGYADKCLQLNNSLMNYNTLSTTANTIGDYNPEVIFHDLLFSNSSTGFLTGGCIMDTTLYKMYDDNDLRKAIFFKVTSNGILFSGNYNRNNIDLFCGMANDEIYLLRAECFARTGKVTEAMSDLNYLLRNRWKSGLYTDLTAATADEALEWIVQERRKELVMRGIRWVDLRRFNKEERFKTTLHRIVGGKTYTLEPSSYKYSFPLPSEVIQLSGMPQTPGW